MAINRIVANALSIFLLVLFGWSIFAGVGDLRTWIMLGAGSAFGRLYTALGHIPEWIVNHSGGSITDDDDPSNTSRHAYVPILPGVMAVAIFAFIVVLRFFQFDGRATPRG